MGNLRVKGVKADGAPIPREELGTMFDYAVRRFMGGIRGLQKGYSGPADAGIVALDRVIASLPSSEASYATKNALAELRSNMIQLERHISQNMPYEHWVRSINYQSGVLSRILNRLATSEPIKAKRAIAAIPPRKSVKAGLNRDAYLNIVHRLQGEVTTLQSFRPSIMEGSDTGIEFVTYALKEVQRAQMILQNSTSWDKPDSMARVRLELQNAAQALRRVQARPENGRPRLEDLITARNAIQLAAKRLYEAFVPM